MTDIMGEMRRVPIEGATGRGDMPCFRVFILMKRGTRSND